MPSSASASAPIPEGFPRTAPKEVRLISNGDKILHKGELLEVTNTSTRNGFEIYVKGYAEPFFTYDRDEGDDTLDVQ